VGPTRMFWQRLSGYCKRELRRGAATLPVKLKSYRGDPGHDEIDILANNAISDLKVDREWCQRRNQAVFTLKNTVLLGRIGKLPRSSLDLQK